MDPDMALGALVGEEGEGVSRREGAEGRGTGKGTEGRTMDINKASDGSTGQLHQNDPQSPKTLNGFRSFNQQHRPWTSSGPLVATQATDINADPNCSRTSNPDKAFSSSMDLNITIASGAARPLRAVRPQRKRRPLTSTRVHIAAETTDIRPCVHMRTSAP